MLTEADTCTRFIVPQLRDAGWDDAPQPLEHLPPEQLVESIMEKEKRILEIMGEIKALLAEGPKG